MNLKNISKSANKSFILLALVGLVTILAFAAINLVKNKAAELAENLGDGIEESFGIKPEILVDKNVYVQGNTEIFEVAVVSRSVSVDYRKEHTWLASTKRLYLQGFYTAKAGFDMRAKSSSISIERGNPIRVIVNLPNPELLSLETKNYEVILDENGYWNKIDSKEREEAIREMKKDAQKEALKGGILEDAQRTVEARVKEIIRDSDVEVELNFSWKYTNSE